MPLEQHIKADAVVVGAGMAGILTAYRLSQRGMSTVVLEAGRVGGGVTGNTTAKITAQHNLCYEKFITAFGEEQARQYAEANMRAVEQYAEIVSALKIACDFERVPAYVYARYDDEPLRAETKAAQRLGIPAVFTKETSLPFQVIGAVKFENQAQFHPLRFLTALADKLQIYESTPVSEIRDSTAITPRGSVHAAHIVIATHFPFINTPGYYFLRMHQQRSYVLALENAQKLDGMYIDADPQGWSLRSYENLLLLGGAGHRTGKHPQHSSYQALREAARTLYPQSRELYAWSAQDCMTLDGVPYIGYYSADTPHVYVATGFNKWGMTSSMAAAAILSDRITGRENPNAQVFTPQRFKPGASIANLMKDGAQAVAGLSKQLFSVPETYLSHIGKGQGGIVEYDDQKLGAYRDEAGHVYLVSTKCPHLGCQLTWNPDERSWDCPCHGSRFDYRGNLLDNPAMRGLDIE